MGIKTNIFAVDDSLSPQLDIGPGSSLCLIPARDTVIYFGQLNQINTFLSATR